MKNEYYIYCENCSGGDGCEFCKPGRDKSKPLEQMCWIHDTPLTSNYKCSMCENQGIAKKKPIGASGLAVSYISEDEKLVAVKLDNGITICAGRVLYFVVPHHRIGRIEGFTDNRDFVAVSEPGLGIYYYNLQQLLIALLDGSMYLIDVVNQTDITTHKESIKRTSDEDCNHKYFAYHKTATCEKCDKKLEILAKSSNESCRYGCHVSKGRDREMSTGVIMYPFGCSTCGCFYRLNGF